MLPATLPAQVPHLEALREAGSASWAGLALLSFHSSGAQPRVPKALLFARAGVGPAST